MSNVPDNWRIVDPPKPARVRLPGRDVEVDALIIGLNDTQPFPILIDYAVPLEPARIARITVRLADVVGTK